MKHIRLSVVIPVALTSAYLSIRVANGSFMGGPILAPSIFNIGGNEIIHEAYAHRVNNGGLRGYELNR